MMHSFLDENALERVELAILLRKKYAFKWLRNLQSQYGFACQAV